MVSAICIMAYPQKENPSDPLPKQISTDSVDYKSLSGSYLGIIETGYAFGLGTYGMNNFKLTFINSLKTGPYFSIGLGVGLIRKYEKQEFYDSFKWPSIGNDFLYPVFLDFRTNILNKKTSPFLAIGIGGYFGVYGMWAGYKGGFYFDPSAGVRFKVLKKCAIIAALDYQFLIMEFFDSSVYPDATYTRENVSSLGFKIGFSF
jgi:hypothetical protein